MKWRLDNEIELRDLKNQPKKKQIDSEMLVRVIDGMTSAQMSAIRHSNEEVWNFSFL